MKVLSIETSCDETAAALVEWNGTQATVLANTVSSQASLHAKWGGVVPDLASREHLKNIVPVIEETLDRAKITPTGIDLIAVTEGPGLMPALVIGVTAAKILSFIWNKPLIGIQHLEGHIYANLLQEKTALTFPLLALVVSGGHTELVLMKDHFQYEILGETQDDAAGEAFDKVAKMLGLDYPGGPIVARKADAYRERNFQFPISNFQTNPNDSISKIKTGLFPRPMIDSDNFDFSFSGLKTSVLYFLKKHEEQQKDESFIDEICHEFQEAVVDVLVAKTKKALALYSPTTFVIAGGVSANVRLRNQLRNLIDAMNLEAKPLSKNIDFLTPEFTYSLDNAAMVGVAAAIRYEHLHDHERVALNDSYRTLEPNANLALKNLT
ncbi:MAG: tRNA (adenosine(37)-N6)-threonylcarbamoyltransferase complex transferase subunit TsaD [Candidatus Moranbacteria bacterium]|jgi:N6-L-threonylcarbamoyladenine synthase|nr:tRNA (adenosine(37)-N6)-threonylcarbamoyltransferase complex transferase subunit TsaD [Candidatus Moranbacteria bacterium]